ncbi:MAG: hypothetical protein BM557_01555 [Flavobacterium sp. MedPE-SWcel]|nr:MAG: hypothetical protein BM557_01555 [Flavobacterium sp. MedPE-SWcel]
MAQETQQPIHGNNNKIKEVKDIKYFNRIVIDGPFQVKLIKSINANNIILKGSENIISLIKVTTTDDGLLTIALPNNIKLKGHKNNKIKIRVPYNTELKEINLIGSGKIFGKNTFYNDLMVRLSGTGNININLKNKKIEAIVLGSGCITLNGKTNDFTCKLIGSGTINAKQLKANIVDAIISGAGNIKTKCNKSIKGKISGTGILTFTGNPDEKSFKRIGSGEFKAF